MEAEYSTSVAQLYTSAAVPRDLILAELRGSLIGLGRYHKARRTAAVIAQTFGPIAPVAPLDATCERVVSTKTSAPFDGTQTR